MVSYPGSDKDSARLSDNAAAVLLARATQLDSVNRAKTSIAELRQAALDAGIAPDAFEQALAEFRAASTLPDIKRADDRRPRWRWMAGWILLVALLLATFVSRLFPPTLP
jgi:hypothetical protein